MNINEDTIALVETAINNDEELVDDIKKSADEPSNPMSPEDFDKWLDQHSKNT